jgi:SSS family solute:Na+ symporter
VSELLSASPVLWICLAYIGVVLALGLAPQLQASSSVAGFVAGDRAMNTVVLYFLLAGAIFSAFAFLGMPGWAYSRGAAAYFVLAYGAFGLVPLWFIGPKLRRLGAARGFVTPGELLAWRFDSPALSTLLATLTVIALVPYLTLQMKGAGYILSVVSEGRVPEAAGAAIAYGAVTIYVVFGGVAAVGWTNVLQAVLMALIAWGIGLWLPWSLYGGVDEMFTALIAADRSAFLAPPGLTGSGQAWDWWGYSSAIAVSAIGFCCWPHFLMRAFAARSDRALKWIVLMYPTFTVFLIPILLIGFAGILRWPGITPSDAVVPTMVFGSGMPVLVVAVMCVGVLAASMSSGDAIMHAAGAVAVRDGVRPLRARALDDRVEHRAMQVVVVLFSLVAFWFAAASSVSLVGLLLASYGGIAQVMPVLLAAFYWRGASAAGVLAGLGGGLAVNLLFLLQPEWRPWPMHEGVYGLLANVILLVVVSRLTRPPPVERIDACVEARWD